MLLSRLTIVHEHLQYVRVVEGERIGIPKNAASLEIDLTTGSKDLQMRLIILIYWVIRRAATCMRMLLNGVGGVLTVLKWRGKYHSVCVLFRVLQCAIVGRPYELAWHVIFVVSVKAI